MKKIHQSPEFTVIKQNQANAKFFVASGFGTTSPNSTPESTQAPTSIPGVTKSSASSYDSGSFSF